MKLFHRCSNHLDKNCTCTVCGKTDFHKFDKSGSCTVCGKKCFHKLDQNGFCTVCGKDLHMCRNHLDTNGVCRVCGKKTHMCKDHLNANSVCTVCGKKYHKCSDHLDTNCTCTVCGKKIENRTSPEPHSHYYTTVETRKIYASCEWANDRCTGRCCEHYSESSTAKKQQCIVCDKAFWLIDDRKVSDYEAKIPFESQCSDWGHSWVNGRCETCGEVRKQDS